MHTYVQLLDELSESGSLSAEWRGAFERAPRSAFVPGRIWSRSRSSWLDRATDPDGWEAMVNADQVVITQLDDGDDNGPGVATSSASTPSLVARMLHHLGVTDGDRVLDIGTGTGWTAALLSTRLGATRVTTVEVDPDIAAQAQAALHAQGLLPAAAVADGLAGWARSAPYDAIHSTAAVQRLPAEWLAQTRPGGIIVTPWGTPYANAALLRLEVAQPGLPSHGRFVENASFMWIRAQRPQQVSRPGQDPDSCRASAMDPDLAVEHVHAAFGIGLRLPGVRYLHTWEPSDPAASYRMQLTDQVGSWASVRGVDWHKEDAVQQLGARKLWDEVEAARRWWVEQGRPELTRFGLTVHPDGRQIVWLDSPDQPVR
ncbi:methyltransferase domain-containing protein [Kitasatospora sp. NPDC006697]|uniref:methyltransferase domain-containing protein n=1 Tax=Kitasatospora sp. NPDC006697 TaxID=3364020 RepID=UPI003676AB3E